MLFNKALTFAFLVVFAASLYLFGPPAGLTPEAWRLTSIFVTVILSIMLNFTSMGLAVMVGITATVLTNVLSIEEALKGFSSNVVWLVIFAFFISKAIVKSQLGKRVAYFFIAQLGRTHIGLSYGILFTEFLISPLIPSATARGGGIMYPVARALIDQYSDIIPADEKKQSFKINQFLMQLCFHSNIITSSMFLTSMAGNSLIAILASKVGSKIEWLDWAAGAIVPGLCSLFILPIVLNFLIKPNFPKCNQAPALARTVLQEMGPLSRNEIVVLITFAILISLWIGANALSINPTTTALLGFLMLVVANVITWEEAIMDKDAWKTFMWFAGFITFATQLSDFGVTKWLGGNLNELIRGQVDYIAIPLLILAFFYMHYLFASTTVYSSVMYVTFAMTLIDMGMSSILACLVLAFFANLSACITHYGISSAPIFFGSGQMKVLQWWKIGFCMSILHLLLWSTIGMMWWKTIGMF